MASGSYFARLEAGGGGNGVDEPRPVKRGAGGWVR